MTRSARIGLVAALLVGLALVIAYAIRWLDVDQCLDRGGRFDYDNSSCDMSE
jgi:hypothetical protein